MLQLEKEQGREVRVDWEPAGQATSLGWAGSRKTVYQQRMDQDTRGQIKQVAQ